jgi:DNA mismatch repair protein MutS
MTAGLSPMMKQYTEIKRQNEDKLLFYRLGDFYELFFDDAVTASRELELVLTGRECGMSERAPMCGVPCHSYEGYVAKLVSRGYKVAICEQTEAPAQAKGIVRREIVRVVTPGTVTDSGMLSEEANNYICSLYLDGSGFGLSFADISTGTVHVTESAGGADAVMEELSRFEPREIICNEPAFLESRLAAYAGRVLGIELSMLYDAYFDLDLCKDMVSRQFDGAQLAGMWNFKKGRALYSLGALVRYLSETQFHGSSRLVALETYRCAQYLSIPAASRRSLELVAAMRSGERRGSLLWVLDRTRTAMGKRLMRSFLDKPLLDPADINRRLDSVGELHGDTVTLTRLRGELEGIHDIERLMTRITYRSATPRDLVSLAAAGAGISAVKGICGALSSPLAATLADSLDTLDDLKERIEAVIADEPPAQIKEGGFIRDGFDPEIDELRGLLGNSKSYLARMEGELRKKTGIKTLKIGYNRVFGYNIEVSRNSSANVPESFVRRQTLAGGERYINDELKQLEEKILSAGERLSMLERGRYDQLLDFVEGALKRVQATAAAIAHIDVLASFAFLARENGYCRPSVDSGDVISIRNGRHPVVETVMDGELFVPNDVSLDCGENLVNIITGPNMAGKSTYMRQTALIVIMAQMGCFVPAASARIGVVDAVFTRVGASDDLFAGDSTFMVEMKEVAGILSSATRRSLIILDEIGRGTSTYDGMSIAQAVIERICGSVGAKTMFATHYHELTGIEAELSGVRNYSVAVKRRGDDITFLRRIVRGPADDSYGIEVARLAGLPAETVGRARDILRSLESREPRAAPADPPPSSDTDDSVRAGRVMSALAAVQVEKLTPVEAMYKLDEIKRMAAREASGEPGGKG